MTTEYVETVGRIAYIWGWALVNNSNRRSAFAKVPEPGRLGGVLPAAPTGYIGMLFDYIDSAERFVTCPNQDTVYGAGFMALDNQPVVVQVPDFGDRFFTYQIVDHRTDSFATIGKQYGTKPGHYLLTGAELEGQSASRNQRCVPFIHRSRRCLPARLSGRYTGGQGGGSESAHPGDGLSLERV